MNNSNKIMKSVLLLFIFHFGGQAICQTVTYTAGSSHLERLAAKEVRRYLYLRTGLLLPVQKIQTLPAQGDLILVVRDTHPVLKEVTSLQAPAGGFFIKSVRNQQRHILVIAGDDNASTLFGAYRFAEMLGCRFYFHGDVIPDARIALQLSGFDEQGQPVTKDGRQWTTRGVQPFQNFPPGVVMFGKDDWKAVVQQLPKMGMNFIGLHTYMADPEDDHVGDYGPTLNIWLGHENDLNPDGTVNFAFDATFFHTQQSIIGWGKTNTSELFGGTSHLFPSEGYPSEIIGQTYHKDQKGYCASFNRAAGLFREVFTFANELGVKTATGIEIPLGRDGESGQEPLVSGIPELLQDRLKTIYGIDPLSQEATVALFKGMYMWLNYNKIPVDYFWLWTTEIWMPWGGASLDSVRIASAKASIKTAVDVFNAIPAKPFHQFALGGWITGAQGNPDVFSDVLPDLNSAYACMNPPYDKNGKRMKTHEWIGAIPSARIKWPFTWLEYDYALEQPSFHMNRVFEDAWEAYEQNADGFLGEFWRTKMIAPMFAAFKDVTWNYAPASENIEHNLPSDRTARNQKIDAVYRDWAVHEFGPGPAAEHISSWFAAFEKEEDRRFKNVMDFIEGADDIYSQGYITGGDWGSDHRWGPWDEEKSWFKWIDDWGKLRDQIRGAGNSARFDYWFNVLQAYKLMAHFASELNQYDAETSNGYLEQAAAHRSKLARLWEQIMTTQVQRVYDEVDLGVILNLHWRTWRNWVEGRYDRNFMEAGGKLPPDKDPCREYTGAKFLTCMPLLTLVKPDEAVDIKAIIMGKVNNPVLWYRTLGGDGFIRLPMTHEGRGVFRVTIPGQKDDFEWYVTANTSLGKVVFPATANADHGEQMYQTVVVAALD